MSEEAGGKIKSKRQHGSNKPYERRKSLLGKVKDLITPSWLSSFVNNKKSDETTETDDTKSEVPASSSIHGRTKQQNDKRPAPVFVSLEKRNGLPSQLMAPPQSTVIAHTRSGEVSQSFKPDQFPLQAGFTSSQLPLIPEKMYEHHYHHVDNDDNMSDRSDHSKSTSGCSSMIPHPPSTVLKDRVTLELNESDIDSIKDKLVDSSDKLPNRLGKSLTWTAQYNTKRPKKPALVGKPSFDVSLFGSPAPGNNSSLSHDRLNESAFYPGRTTFGGASSQRRQSLNTTAPYVSSPFPVRQKMKAKPLNNSFAGSATTSGTARKILETLEKMTTPLGDARKIPVDDTVMQSLSSSFSFTPSVYRRPTRHSIGSYMNSSRELQTPNRGPPLQRVSTPGSASIAANLQRFVPTRESTETTGSYQLPGSSQKDPGMSSTNTQGGKMKSKKFTSHHVASRKDEDEDDPFEMPQLRTEFTLPVKDMPTFNFNMPKSTPQRTTKDLSSQAYTFSTPIQKMPVTPTDTPTGPPKMTYRATATPGQYFVREIPVMHESSNGKFRSNGQPSYPSQQGFGTLPRQMDMPSPNTYSSTLPRSFRTGSPMSGRSSSPVVREIPIQHLSSNQASQPQPPPQQQSTAQHTGPYGYTIYTGQQPGGGGPGQPVSYPQQPPPPFTSQQPAYAQASSNSSSQGGYPPHAMAQASAQAGYPNNPQSSGYSSSTQSGGYPNSTQGSYPDTTWTAASPQSSYPQTTPQTAYPQASSQPQSTNTQTGPLPSQQGTSLPQTTPQPETISQEPKLREIPIAHETFVPRQPPPHQQTHMPQQPHHPQQQQQKPQEQRVTPTPSSQSQRSETPNSSRQSPETAAQSGNGNGTSTLKKKPSTPMEQIEEVVNNIGEYEMRVTQFKGTKKDKEYKVLEEMLTRNLLKLDGVEAGCDDNVRQRRKQTVKEIQAYLDQLELKAFSQEQSCEMETSSKDERTENNNKSASLESAKPNNNGNGKTEPMDTSDLQRKSDFKFSSPIQQGDGSSSPTKSKSVTFNLGDDNDVQMKYNYKSSTVSTSSLTGSPVAQGFSKPVSQTSSSSSSPSSGGFKVASQLKTGSVMDILGKSGSAQKKSPEAPKNDSLAKFAVKGWTCDICLVGNKEDSDKCVACTSPRPGAKTLVPKNDSLAKFAVKGWTCDICLVGNKDESDKCVACTSPRPGAKTSVPKNDSFAKFAGKGWTCNVCLVSNKDDAEKCVACAEAKPGLKKSTSKSAGGDSLQSIFKKPTGNWDCDVCLVPNNGDVTKCLACETPRPGTQPSSSGGLTIAPGAFSGQSGFILPTGSNSNSNMSNSGFGGDTKSSSGSGFKFSGGTTSAGSGFKFGDCSVKLSNDSDKQSSNVKSDNKEKEGFVFGKSNSFSPQKSAPSGTGFKFGENKPDEINKSGFLSQNSLSGTKDKSSASGFMSGKTSADSSDKTDGVSKLKSDSTVILDSPKISVTTSTVATTGLAFNSKSDSETKTSTTPGGINFGQSVSAIKPANGGFVFGQTSNNDTNVKTSVNSIFGTSSSNKSDNSTSIFGSDPKTSSINNFTGTNNSGFSFNKTEDKKSEPSFNNQSSTVSPSLKRSRDDETGPAEKKKPFAAPSSASSGLFQFGVKSTAITNASPSMAFGQNKDSKPTAFAAPSFNFGGAAPTNSATGFNAVPQTTTSSIFNSTGSSISSGTVFGSAAATVTSTSTGSSFVFGASSANPTTSSTTFGSTQQTSSLFSNKSSTPTFGTSSSIPSFGSPISTVGGFGSTAPAFGSSSTNPQFGASQPSATSGFGAQQTATPSFGTPQTTAPAFGTTQTSVPAFGAPQSSNPSFGTPQKPSGPVFGAAQNTTFGPPPVTSTTPGGFNFNAAPSFNFGQSSNTPQQPAAPSAGIFQFGGPKQAEAPQQPTVPSGGFNFGQAASTPGGAPYSFSAAPTPAATPSFGAGFGQPSTPQQSGTGMFNIGAGSTDNRKIKKAVRKIRR